MRQATLAANQVATLPETDDIGTETTPVEIEPIPGSEAITFSNYKVPTLVVALRQV